MRLWDCIINIYFSEPLGIIGMDTRNFRRYRRNHFIIVDISEPFVGFNIASTRSFHFVVVDVGEPSVSVNVISMDSRNIVNGRRDNFVIVNISEPLAVIIVGVNTRNFNFISMEARNIISDRRDNFVIVDVSKPLATIVVGVNTRNFNFISMEARNIVSDRRDNFVIVGISEPLAVIVVGVNARNFNFISMDARNIVSDRRDDLVIVNVSEPFVGSSIVLSGGKCFIGVILCEPCVGSFIDMVFIGSAIAIPLVLRIIIAVTISGRAVDISFIFMPSSIVMTSGRLLAAAGSVTGEFAKDLIELCREITIVTGGIIFGCPSVTTNVGIVLVGGQRLIFGSIVFVQVLIVRLVK
jgi:hypothetical protein